MGRNPAGRLWLAPVVLGTAVLLYPAVYYLTGTVEQALAQRDWRPAAVSPVGSATDGRFMPPPPQKGSAVARLIIPKIGLDSIVFEGTGRRQLRRGPGHDSRSVLPGIKDNSVISAHVDGPFRSLSELRPGDEILTQTDRGTFRWIVVSRRIVGAKDRTLIVPAAEPMLTLTTCYRSTPVSRADKRLGVIAKLQS